MRLVLNVYPLGSHPLLVMNRMENAAKIWGKSCRELLCVELLLASPFLPRMLNYRALILAAEIRQSARSMFPGHLQMLEIISNVFCSICSGDG